jgi:hypothetical protein
MAVRHMCFKNMWKVSVTLAYLKMYMLFKICAIVRWKSLQCTDC